jgi:hypothetical protein
VPISVSEAVAEVIDTNAGDLEALSTGAFTPSDNSLLVVMSMCSGTAVVGVPSGGSLTWTQREATSAVASTYTAPVTTGASMTVTVTWSGDAPTSAFIVVFQVTGYRLGSPVVQARAISLSAQTSSTLDFSFASALGTNNAYMLQARLLNDNALNSTPPTSWTEVADGGVSAPVIGYTAAFRAAGETGTAYSFDVDDFVGQNYTVVGIEISAPLAFSQSAGGTLTPAGALALKTKKVLAGTLKLFGTFSLLKRLPFRLTAPWKKTSLTAQQADTSMTAPMADTDLRGEHE